MSNKEFIKKVRDYLEEWPIFFSNEVREFIEDLCDRLEESDVKLNQYLTGNWLNLDTPSFDVEEYYREEEDDEEG